MKIKIINGTYGHRPEGALQPRPVAAGEVCDVPESEEELPIIFNDYMNCLMGDPNEEILVPLIDRARAIGAEYFCIDCGWYADGLWWDSVGEWQPSAQRFPSGIAKTLDYIRDQGMIPGLWLEIESMGVKCQMAQQLPDSCFLMRHGKRVVSEQRYHLDFRHELVRAHADAVVRRLVEDYGVGYIRELL